MGYIPLPDFQEDNKESLVDIELNDNIELWLIQLPDDQFPDFDGQEVSLELEQEGQLGSLEGPSGKGYNLVSFPSEVSDITVFLSSLSGPRTVGKISRHVSLVHYPEPDELKLKFDTRKQMPLSSKTSLTNSSHPFLIPSTSQRNLHSQSRSRSTHISKRSSLSEVSDASRHPKRRVDEQSRISNQSARDSGRGQSEITFSGSSEQSHQKKKRKTDSEA